MNGGGRFEPEGFPVPDEARPPVPAPPVPHRATQPSDSYRDQLLKLEEKAQATFDKTLVTLAGGALGVSFAFVKDLLGGHIASAPGYLLGAWVLWTVSLASTLTSHYSSAAALRRTVSRLDEGREEPTNWLDKTTSSLNALALVAFLAGLVLAGIFVARNLGA